MNTVEEEPMIEVPLAWFKQIAYLASRVHDQMNQLPAENYQAFVKTDINILLGYASSAEEIIKLQRIADRKE